MAQLWDFSEISEAAELFGALSVTPSRSARVPSAPVVKPDIEQRKQSELRAPSESSDPPIRYRSERLDDTLASMCKRGRFSGGVVADRDGLPLAVFNSPVDAARLAAFTTVLGESLERAGSMLDQHDANNIAIDINYTDKVVVRRFRASGVQYYLLIICGQNVDERSEVEVSVEQLGALLSA